MQVATNFFALLNFLDVPRSIPLSGFSGSNLLFRVLDCQREFAKAFRKVKIRFSVVFSDAKLLLLHYVSIFQRFLRLFEGLLAQCVSLLFIIVCMTCFAGIKRTLELLRGFQAREYKAKEQWKYFPLVCVCPQKFQKGYCEQLLAFAVLAAAGKGS